MVGAACEALTKATYDFAQNRDYRLFPRYLKKVIGSAVLDEVMFQRYGVAKGRLGKKADWRDVAAETGQPVEKARILDTIGQTVILYGAEAPKQSLYSTHERESPIPTKILVERGLSLLTPDRADIIAKYYGISELTTYTIRDLADERQIGAKPIVHAAMPSCFWD